MARTALGILTLAIGSLYVASLTAAEQRAVLAFVGALDSVSVGQEGYCGDRTYANRKTKLGFYVEGGRKVWLGLKTKVNDELGSVTCEGEYSFVPEPGQTYIVRLTWQTESCLIEMFRAVPGGTPVPENIYPEPAQSCILEKVRPSASRE